MGDLQTPICKWGKRPITVMGVAEDYGLSLFIRVAQLLTARSGINICYSTKLRESKNTNFSFLPFTSDPFFKPRSSPASWAECARARPS